jgi:D-ribose pyranose/furanose isomerase RbsD
MFNLSPDHSAKTMMTNVSRMVETLGTVVNTLVKENANMAKETTNTNDTIKQMMIQQTATMNNFTMLMTRNEERGQEVPISVVQKTSTPNILSC